MRDGLLTGVGAKRPESVLSGPLFSKADDCADLVLSFKTLNINGYFQRPFWSVCENVRLADRIGVGIALSKTDFPTFIPVERDPVRLFDTYCPMRISLQPCMRRRVQQVGPFCPLLAEHGDDLRRAFSGESERAPNANQRSTQTVELRSLSQNDRLKIRTLMVILTRTGRRP